MHLQTSTPPVPQDVAGGVVVPTELMRKKLGHAAFVVWQILISRRDRHGLTHTTRVGMTRTRAFEKLSERSIKKALARLREAQLIEDLGWRSVRLPNGAQVDAYWRLVRGARIAAEGATHRALVTTAAARWLDRAAGHGGTRLGAGRPRGPVLRLIEGGAGGNAAHEWKSRGSNPHPPGDIQEGPPIRSSLAVSSPKVFSDPLASLRGSEKSPLRGDFSCEASSAQPERSSLDVQKVRMAWSGNDDQRVYRPSSMPRPRPMWVHNEAVPPWPTLERVPQAKIPRPPLLDASLGPQRRRSVLARWYQCAVESRFGKSKHANAAMAFHGSRKIAALLDAAARKFVELEIAPAAWCAWQCDLHLRHAESEDQKKPPAIWIVFAASVIEKHAQWFQHEVDTIGGRLVHSEAGRELSQRYFGMQRDLRDACAVTADLARPIVARWFPEGLYHELCARAHNEAAALQQSINSAARTGERWLW